MVNAFGPKFPARSLPALLCAAALCLLLSNAGGPALAQNSSSRGVPAESRQGQSGASTYARDKIETVNLANGNFTMSIPLATVGGRGSAAFRIALTYNSKVWTSQADGDPVELRGGAQGSTYVHYSAMYEEDFNEQEPGVMKLGGGWTILYAPAVKGLTFGIDPVTTGCTQVNESGARCGYKYALSKLWLSLPDGSQVELRDGKTEGAPSLITDIRNGYHHLIDRERGRVWHSFDGSNVTFVADTGEPVRYGISGEKFAPSGWVFIADGTRLRMIDGVCAKIIDADGNFITIGPDGYTDSLGRKTVLGAEGGLLTVTVKGDALTPDRITTVELGQVGLNLRADFDDSVNYPRPFTTGDMYHDQLGDETQVSHAIQGAHTDLFHMSDGSIAYGSNAGDDVGLRTAVKRLNLLDGRSFAFRYNVWGEVAEVVYPGGGVSRIDYEGRVTSVCEVNAPLHLTLNRQVSARRTLTAPPAVDATWSYEPTGKTIGGTAYRGVSVNAYRGDGVAPEHLLSTELHLFKRLNAEYRPCMGPHTDTGDEKWFNAKEFRTEVSTGAGETVTTVRNWENGPQVMWADDVNSTENAYVREHGPESDLTNEPRVTWEETTLKNGRTKRVEYGYDQFLNVTSVREYDFGTPGAPGALLRQTVNTYVGNVVTPSNTPSYNGYCYT
jgi:hypothetical protein